MALAGTTFRLVIGTTVTKVLERNPNRIGLTLQADAGNSGTIYFNFDDPAIVSTAGSTKLGIPLAAGTQAVDEPPGVNGGEVWAVGSAASQTLIIIETTEG